MPRNRFSPRGIEPNGVSGGDKGSLGDPASSRGAESGAGGAETGHFNLDLQHVIDAWPMLPEAVRAGILAIVDAAKSTRPIREQED